MVIGELSVIGIESVQTCIYLLYIHQLAWLPPLTFNP